MKHLTLSQLGAGHAHLQELINPGLESDTDDDVPEFPPPDSTIIEGDISPPAPPPSPGAVATPKQLDTLRQLARDAGNKEYADVQDLIEHNPGGIPVDDYQRIKARLQTRGQQGKPSTEKPAEQALLDT